MKAEFDHAGRLLIAAETPAESVALRLLFAGEDGSPTVSQWAVSNFHSDGTRPVEVSLLLLPAGPIQAWATAEGAQRPRFGTPMGASS